MDQQNAVTITQEQLDAMLASAVTKAVAAALAKVTPVAGAAAVDGKRQVRLKHDLEPPHGEPCDRVGTVEKVLRRVLFEGKEDEVLAVRFGDVVEEHIASTLVGV
jgi:hypothetical protein